MSVATQTFRGFGGGGGIDALVRRGFASYTGLPQPPALGWQYADCGTAPYTGGGYSFETGQSPAIAVGDVFSDTILTSPSGFSNIINGDGTIEVFSGGNVSRQSLQYQFYRVASNALSATGTVWLNELAPVWHGVPNFPASLVLGQALSPINLASVNFCVSPEGDTMAFSLNSGTLPPGLSLSSSGVLSGIPMTVGSYSFTVSATDSTQSSTVSPSIAVSVTQTVAYATILATVEALSAANVPIHPTFVYQYSASVPDGYVISISPGAGTVISPGQYVQLTVSMGPANPIMTTGIPYVVGGALPKVVQQLTAARCSVGTITYVTGVAAPNTVLSQNPGAVTPVPLWTSVSLVVCSGPAITYPNTTNPVVPPLP